MTPPLALSNIVDISVTVAPSAATANSFNQGCFVGPTAVPSNGRISQYPSTTAMLSAGYTTSSPEFIAAQIYFSQTPSPQFIWIGQQYASAISALAPDGRTVLDGVMSSTTNPTHLSSATASFVIGDAGSTIRVAGAGTAGADLVTTISSYTSSTVVVLASPCLTTISAAAVGIGFVGSGYVAGDVVSVAQLSATGGYATVLTVVDGMVETLGVAAGTQGYGYSIATGLTTTAVSPSIGTGLEVNITAIGETLLQPAARLTVHGMAWRSTTRPTRTTWRWLNGPTHCGRLHVTTSGRTAPALQPGRQTTWHCSCRH
jgi:hypothetical protein